MSSPFLLRAVVPALFVAVASSAGSARAQPIRDNHYSIDLFQGPILAPIGIMGIAGAYSPYAEGIQGFVSNAATPAVREPFRVRYLEWDAAASISIPLPLFEKNDDFDNSGTPDFDYSDFVYITAGAFLQYGPLGFGANAEVQRYTLTSTTGKTSSVTIGKYNLLAGYRFLGDQLVVGAGARLVTLNLDAGDTHLAMAGAAPQVGLLIRPDWRPFRVGATFRAPVDGGAFLGSAVDEKGIAHAGNLIVPEHVVLPWELQFGVAVQVGPRPLNPAWIDPRADEVALRERIRAAAAERSAKRAAELARIGDLAERAAKKRLLDAEEVADVARDRQEEAEGKKRLEANRRARYENWPREHLLLIADFVITGPVDRGVSVQRFLGQNQPTTAEYDPSLLLGDRFASGTVGSSGLEWNFSPRVGVEAEPVPGWVHTRVGTYYEPSRLANHIVGRQHFTFGADLKLFRTAWFGLFDPTTYKLQFSADLSPRYQSLSLGIGNWN